MPTTARLEHTAVLRVKGERSLENCRGGLLIGFGAAEVELPHTEGIVIGVDEIRWRELPESHGGRTRQLEERLQRLGGNALPCHGVARQEAVCAEEAQSAVLLAGFVAQSLESVSDSSVASLLCLREAHALVFDGPELGKLPAAHGVNMGD